MGNNVASRSKKAARERQRARLAPQRAATRQKLVKFIAIALGIVTVIAVFVWLQEWRVPIVIATALVIVAIVVTKNRHRITWRFGYNHDVASSQQHASEEDDKEGDETTGMSEQTQVIEVVSDELASDDTYPTVPPSSPLSMQELPREPFQVSEPTDDSPYKDKLLWELRQERREQHKIAQETSRWHSRVLAAVERIPELIIAGLTPPPPVERVFERDMRYVVSWEKLPRRVRTRMTKEEADQIVAVLRLSLVKALLPLLACTVVTLGIWWLYILFFIHSVSALIVAVIVYVALMFWPSILVARNILTVYVLDETRIVRFQGVLRTYRAQLKYSEMIGFTSMEPWWGQRLGYWHLNIRSAAEKNRGQEESETPDIGFEKFLKGREPTIAYVRRVYEFYSASQVDRAKAGR